MMRKLLLSLIISTALALPLANAQQAAQSVAVAEQSSTTSEELSQKKSRLSIGGYGEAKAVEIISDSKSFLIICNLVLYTCMAFSHLPNQYKTISRCKGR